jgi:hypothetical protein
LNKTISEDDDPKADESSEPKAETSNADTSNVDQHDHNGNEFDKKMFGVKRKKHPMLGAGEKKGSAIDLDIGPPLDSTQTKNYRTIQQILIRSEKFWFTFISRIGRFKLFKRLNRKSQRSYKEF